MDLNIRKMTNHPPSPGDQRKHGIQGRELSSTLTHGNSKNEIRHRTGEEGKQKM